MCERRGNATLSAWTNNASVMTLPISFISTVIETEDGVVKMREGSVCQGSGSDVVGVASWETLLTEVQCGIKTDYLCMSP